MLEIFIICKNNTAALERLLLSAAPCCHSGVYLTAIAAHPSKLEKLQDKYAFSILPCHSHSRMQILNKAIQTSNADFFMILTEEHIIGAEFPQLLSAALQPGSFSMLNMGYMPNWHTFSPFYPQEKTEITDCLSIRPCIFGCIFDTATAKQKGLTLRSIRIMDQYKYLQQFIDAGSSSIYFPVVNLYIEKIWHCSQPSLFQALFCLSHSQMLRRIYLEDRKASIKDTRWYHKLREVKRILMTEYKKSLYKQIYLLKCRVKRVLKNYI